MYHSTAVKRRQLPGFTLLELMTVIVVVLILSGVTCAVVQGVRNRAYAAREMAAGRQLVASYLMASLDNRGLLLPGYDLGLPARRANGAAISGQAAARYPWRLAPYVNYQFAGTMYVNERAEKLDVSDTYMTSLRPSFGINGYCVGGYNDGSGNYQLDVAHRLSEVPNPAKMIGFASSRMDEQNAEDGATPGFFLVAPPRMGGNRWKAKPGPEALSCGYVDFHTQGFATVAFLDGHVESRDAASLQDMRFWSAAAQRANEPDYQVPMGTTKRGSRR